MDMSDKLKNIFFKIWYWYISTVDKNADVIFMNYGYFDKMQEVVLDELDEKNRYSIQLYHQIAASRNIVEKEILEVGCGRGGGLAYVNNNLSPKCVTGVDLNHKAIEFCKKHYTNSSFSFFKANAQDLPFNDNSFDVVLNVESSHRYPQVDLFLKEVCRVLKPNGYLLFTDFRLKTEIEELDLQFEKIGMQLEDKQDITENVVEALTLATPSREKLIVKLVPKILQNLGRNFAATVGSPTYNKFSTRKYIYMNYILRKQ